MPRTVIKDPQAILDYKFDWAALTNGTGDSDWLASGETLSTTPSDVTVTASTGLTVDSYSLTDTNTSVTCWLSGGTADTDYTVTCHIKTSANRTDDRTLYVKVRQR